MSVIVGKTTLKLTLLHSHDRIGLRIKRRTFIEQPRSDCRLGQLLSVAEERFLNEQVQKTLQPIVMLKRAAAGDSIDLVADCRCLPRTRSHFRPRTLMH